MKLKDGEKLKISLVLFVKYYYACAIAAFVRDGSSLRARVLPAERRNSVQKKKKKAEHF